MSDPNQQNNRVLIFDSTLRDAEQSPGASLNTPEKVEIAHQLARLGVDIIEAGFPVSSPVQFEAVEIISKEVEGPVIASLARTVKKDIDAAAQAMQAAPRKRIHTFTSTSPQHMEYMLKMTPDVVLQKAVEAIQYAKSYTDDVEFSAQDATRSDVQFLKEVVQAAIEAGATTINIPDTVGYAIPEEYGRLIATLMEIPGADRVILSTHCHNDLGLATANSLAGVLNGARQIECTMNGLGERAGNASLEECVMAMNVRNDFCHLHTKVRTQEIYRTSQMVSKLMGMPIQPNKAIVGTNAFAHESGIHVDGLLKNRSTYEIMTPESVGVTGTKLVLGRHTGRHGFKKHCEELGFVLDESQLESTYQRFLELADKKKEIFDDDVIALLDEKMRSIAEVFQLDYLHCASGSGVISTATVRINRQGQPLLAAALGDGPVDATYKAIRKATQLEPELENYSIRAVTGSSEALGEAILRIRYEGKTYIGRGISTDIIEASAKAYVNALNIMMLRINRTVQNMTD